MPGRGQIARASHRSKRATRVLAGLLLALASGTACVGSLEERTDPTPTDAGAGAIDAAATGDGAPGASDAAAPDAGTYACDEPNVTGESGRHRAGEACMTGCHTDSTSGPTFTIGGTLYASAAGGATIEGATVHIIDANDDDIALSTAANGNFWTDQPVTFPIRAYASRCPSVELKINAVTAAQDGGNCNRSGCHVAGARIALP